MAKEKNTLVIGFILDETGSMEACKDQTITGFNEYVQSLKKEKADISFTLTKFNSERIKTVCRDAKLSKVPQLDNENYIPNAMTPLFDTVGRIIREVEAAVKKKKNKPRVIISIQTDGYENASVEYTQESIKKLIKEKEDWTFTFLGAGDSWVVAERIGIAKGNVMGYDPRNTKRTFAGAAAAICAFSRSGDPTTKQFFKDAKKE